MLAAAKHNKPLTPPMTMEPTRTYPKVPSFREEVAATSPTIRREVQHSMALAAAIDDVLQARNMTQKDFAKLMGKQESEISKWLSGTHNFTLKTIAKIEAALEVDLLNINSTQEASTERTKKDEPATANVEPSA